MIMRYTEEMVRTATSGPDPIDLHVGKRLKQRRVLTGTSQEKLADALGITFQQIQKYENGSNRMGASRLYQVGKVLDVPVAFFFEGFQTTVPQSETPAALQAAEETPEIDDDVMTRRETLELVKAYYAITNEDTRKKMLAVLRSMSDSTSSSNSE